MTHLHSMFGVQLSPRCKPLFDVSLGQASLTVPWNGMPEWITDLIGFLSIMLLVLMVIYYFRKVFGRRPPIDDALKDLVKTLRSEIHREKNSVLKEFRLKLETVEAGAEKFEDAIELRVSKVESALEDVQLDRARKWQDLTIAIHDLEKNVAFIRGKFERETTRNQ